MFVSLFLFGCGGEAAPPPAPEPAPAPAPEPPPAPAPAAGGVMTVDAVNAGRADLVGQVVTVKGHYSNFTRQDGEPAQINVPVALTAEAGEKNEILCVMPLAAEEAIKAVPTQSELTVHGTVSDQTFFDNTILNDCALGEAGGAPAGEGEKAPREGKAKGGKQKGGNQKSP